MSVDLTIRQGDTTPAFIWTVTDQNGNPVDLTAATATLRVRQLSSGSPIVNAAMTVTNAAAGVVEYAWAATDTQLIGMYMAEIQVVFSDSSTYTYPNEGFLSIEIQQNLLSPLMQLVTVDNVKDVLNMDPDNRVHDTKVLRWINAARPLIENITGPIIPQQFEELHDGGGDFITVWHRPSSTLGTSPILVVNAISEYNGPIEWVLAEVASPDLGQTYSVEVDVRLGRIVRRTAGGGVQPFPYMPQSVHLWYTAGQSSVPDNVAEATLEYLRENYQSTAQALRKAGSRSNVDIAAPPTGYALSYRVENMLEPNRRYPSLA